MPNRREDDGSRSVTSVAVAVAVARELHRIPVAFVARNPHDEKDNIVTVAMNEADFAAAAVAAFQHDVMGRIRVEGFGPNCVTGVATAAAAQDAGHMLGYPLQLVAESPLQGAALAIVARKKPDIEPAFNRVVAVSMTRRVAIRRWQPDA